jgi:hypothetical protein
MEKAQMTIATSPSLQLPNPMLYSLRNPLHKEQNFKASKYGAVGIAQIL